MFMMQRVRQSVRQTQSQQIRIQMVIRQTITKPNAICPQCKNSLSDAEIRRGWRNDPHDVTTECPKCGKRFAASLLLFVQDVETGHHRFLCPLQLFSELRWIRRGKSKILGKTYLFDKHPELFWNLIRHFSTYEEGLKAFKQFMDESGRG